ncbi:putative beta-lysine N-acetyltransferase [Anaerosacchariphilus polymeriproducens]|uniref:Putative beta-lysine N-acetyltransferase n=1 Tax=Anaerosacchariphilus polymeriproducens TaxID=1812858 RepID=A0A371AY58_9FIRM|nr:putative beta-lysine N-acetyltransferase [Anaerosacchariphilus polymeriproducens]RDU24442.1 putative beta-lysine N-acetyltransferase [Anaerosacchariphilus polymeriproducens]
MNDVIQKIGNSIVHHGKQSNRIYLMSLDSSDTPSIVDRLNEYAQKENYTKIIAKVPSSAKDTFLKNEYKEEAMVPNFYHGKEDGLFLVKYLDENRAVNQLEEQCDHILKLAESKEVLKEGIPLEKDFCCRKAEESDIEDMVEVYKKVFKTYPFPIYDKKYIAETMKDNVIYLGIWFKEKLVAISSIEAAYKYSNAEMTDFAILEEYRGNGFAGYLLNEMEKILKDLGIKMAYTIARATSAGMNMTFSKHGYLYSGTLINNTNIAGQIESMNVWYKLII